MANNRKKRIKGIKNRWIFNSLGVVILVLIFAIGAFSVSISDYYYSNIRTSLIQRAQSTSKFFNSYLNLSYSSYYTSAYRYAEAYEEKNKLELQFINSSGRIEVSTSGSKAGYQPRTDDLTGALETGEVTSWVGRDPETGERVMAVSSPLRFSNNQVVGAVRYVTSLRLVDRQVFLMLFGALAIGGIVIFFVIMSNMFFFFFFVVPVQEINEIAKKIAKGSYGIVIDKEFDDEIGELCDTINNMSMEISNAEKVKNEFISSVSHELRTPLTAISGWGETILYMDDPEEMKKGVNVMMKEAKRLTKLVEELLEFTMMDSGRMKLRMETVDIAAEFEEVVFVYMETLKKLGIKLEYNCEDDIPEITGDRERLKQVFFNILDNAAKHGGDGEKIIVDMRAEDGYVIISVQDFGAGIPAEDLPYVKQKFYKGASSARGSGIGLAVADEIVSLHDGSLDIESEVGKGTKVIIKIPQAMGK